MSKKIWFDVPDSLTESEDGKTEYYNVEARFADHPVINVEKSKVARHNVYEYSITLYTRIKYAAMDAPAVKNMHSQPLRFDKGGQLPQTDFEKAVKAIARCWDAWQHYQTFREAPVTDLERQAIGIVESRPAPQSLIIDTGKGLKTVKLDDGREPDADDDDFEDDAGEGTGGSEAHRSPPAPIKPKKPAAKAKKPGKRKAA